MNLEKPTSSVNRRVFMTGTAATVLALQSGRTHAQPNASSQPGSASGTLRIAQIGAQGHHFHITDGIPKLKDCRFIAIARSMPGEEVEVLKKKAAWTPETRVYDDYRKMLDEVKPDVVAVFTPFAQLSEASTEAVRRRCHVISEKPLALDLESLDVLRKERDRSGVRVSAILPYRLFPVFVAAQQAVVQQGAIGEPVLVSVDKSYRWGPESRPDYYKLRKTYGGTIPWIGTHAIDYIRYVTGLEFANVTARQAVKVNKDYPECEDCGALLFEMTNGGQAVLTFNYLRPRRSPSHGDDRLFVTGSKGCLEIRSNNRHICELITNEAPAHQLSLPKTESNVFIDFIQSLRGEKPHILSHDDPFRASEVAIKARQAADLRKTIPL